MKTTVEIPDSLLEEAKRLASREGTTVRALVEEGLRRTLAERKRAKGFRLRKATFKGTGMQPAVVPVPRRPRTLDGDRDFGRFPELTRRNPLVA